MNKKKLYGTWIAIIAFAILIVGATFAWLTYTFNATNGTYNTATTCFDINSSEGQDIDTTLDYVTKPIDGVNTSVSMGLANNCVISANGVIYLNVLSTTSSTLYSTVSAHCENPDTLETLYNYENSSDCTSNNGKWVTNGTALKYAIYDINSPTNSTIPLTAGYITGSGDNTLYDTTLPIGSTNTYYIYFWLDGELIDDNYLETTFSGYVHTQATQNSESINSPAIVDGLIPVKLSASGDTVTAVSKTDPEWYNYDNKEWANAVLVKNTGVKTRAQNSVAGTVINQDDILAYYVWIPRYSYKVWVYANSDSSGSPREIPIKFVSANVKELAQAKEQWYTHPAFTFGNKELAGIWVGKFETSHETLSSNTTNNNLGCTSSSCTAYNDLRILPNVVSLRYNNISNMFYASRTMETSGNSFGLLASSVDSHMMKNSEWGAVAYLSHSKYGINNEVRLNNNSDYTTGCGALTENEAETTNCDNAYKTVSVYPQSTTGNVTGIFDMSGGAYEYVMGNNNSIVDGSGFVSMPEAKYYDNYPNPPFDGTSGQNKNKCTLAYCGGHALYETWQWYGDNAGFASYGSRWFNRGGNYSNGTVSGMFYSSFINTTKLYWYTFRLVLTAK